MERIKRTNWRRRTNADSAKSSPQFTRKAHQVKEWQIVWLRRNRPQFSIPQNKARSIWIAKYKVLLQTAIYLKQNR